MEAKNNQLKSIWGKWWLPIRKWFYPVWLIYELSIRFYEYSEITYRFFISGDYIGELGLQLLAVFSGIATFVICTFFLTAPASFVLYKFFKANNLPDAQFEQKLKVYF